MPQFPTFLNRLAMPASRRTVLLLCFVTLGAVPVRAEESARESVASSAAYGDAELAPYFASGRSKRAFAELQAGRAARALKLIPEKPDDVPTRWLRALALRAANRPWAARDAFERIAAAGGTLADPALHLAGLSAIDGGDAASADR